MITNTEVTEVVSPVSLNELNAPTYNLYHNPVTDVFQISTVEKINATIKIELFDIYGRKIHDLFAGNPGENQLDLKFDISDLSKGIYIISISGYGTMNKKILKW